MKKTKEKRKLKGRKKDISEEIRKIDTAVYSGIPINDQPDIKASKFMTPHSATSISSRHDIRSFWPDSRDYLLAGGRFLEYQCTSFLQITAFGMFITLTPGGTGGEQEIFCSAANLRFV